MKDVLSQLQTTIDLDETREGSLLDITSSYPEFQTPPPKTLPKDDNDKDLDLNSNSSNGGWCIVLVSVPHFSLLAGILYLHYDVTQLWFKTLRLYCRFSFLFYFITPSYSLTYLSSENLRFSEYDPFLQ